MFCGLPMTKDINEKRKICVYEPKQSLALCVSGIWTRLTWPWWIDFGHQKIQLITNPPQNMWLTLKVVKSGLKIITSLL